MLGIATANAMDVHETANKEFGLGASVETKIHRILNVSFFLVAILDMSQ
jgi:hypothetical protein